MQPMSESKQAKYCDPQKLDGNKETPHMENDKPNKTISND